MGSLFNFSPCREVDGGGKLQKQKMERGRGKEKH